MYALVEIQGKQYKAEKGKTIKVDHIDVDPNTKLEIEKVLLVAGDSISVGTPYVKGAKVSAVVESHERSSKIIVFKYIPKKDYRRKRGHRQSYSVIRVEDIAV